MSNKIEKKLDQVMDWLQAFQKDVYTRFERMDERFDNVEGDLADLKGGQTRLNERMGVLEGYAKLNAEGDFVRQKDVTDLRVRVGRIEDQLAEMQT